MATDNNPLLRIATLLDDLKHDELPVRVNSMRHLKEITEALGPERTREELIPFLADTVMDDEDEALLVAAEEFGTLVPQVGGPEHIPSLLRALEELAKVDEPSVRAKAVESINILVPQMKKNAVTSHLIPIIKNLVLNEWFTARSTACSLFATAYPFVSTETKTELRGLFGKLCKDETPTVRKAAAENIGKFATILGDFKLAQDELFPLFEELAKDQQDSVKLHAINNVIAFANLANTQDDKEGIMKFVFTLATDAAWRVKWTVAKNFVEISELAVAAGLKDKYPALIRLFKSLLNDEEPEVKAAAVSKLTDVGRIFAKSESADEFSVAIVPELVKLVSDESDFVRVELGAVILGMAPIVGTDKAIESLVPLFKNLLADLDNQVRLNLIGSLDMLENTVKIDYFSTELFQSITELSQEQQWRTRHAIIGHIPLIARQLGQEVFDEKLIDQCLQFLQDEVYSIRQAATENLSKLTELFGEEWAKKKIFIEIKNQTSNKSYLFRMQALRSIECLAPVVGSDALNAELLEHIVLLASDATPNIRFNVAKCVEKIADKLTPGVLKNDIRPRLVTMADDEDEDVVFFAKRALETVDGLLDGKK